ncbi:MAG: ABC transporter ATP-binding protein [Nitratireductor sp.]|nr:ABC transporter ATP-binding protein [Nitratireductor sp.]
MPRSIRAGGKARPEDMRGRKDRRERARGEDRREGRLGVTIASSLQFSHVSHRYGPHETIRDLSLDIAPGEVVSLLGPSGSGKTTLLRLAAGLQRPLSGEIAINHQVVSNAGGLVPPEKRGIGLVFQDFALFPHMTIRTNVEFGLTKLAAAERKAYALYMLKTVGLDGKADRYPHNLSGGEQQRVALARALAPKPGILLMDEPFSGLDGRLRESVRNETLAILRSTRSTVVVVTHDPEEALNISDRIALMRDGRIVQFGACEELYHRPADLFAARFFSEVNQFSGRLSEGIVDTPVGSFRYRGDRPLPDGPVVVCVRPSDVGILAGEETPDRRRSDGGKALKTAYVQSKRFIGESELVALYIPEGEIRLQAKLPDGTAGNPGDAVRVMLDAARALVFAAGDD